MLRRQALCDAQCACSHAADAVAVEYIPGSVIVTAVAARLLLFHMFAMRPPLRFIRSFCSE